MKGQLRPEAQAVRRDELDSYQTKAFDRVTGLLEAAVAGVPADVSGLTGVPARRAPITRRTSRNILLQGGQRRRRDRGDPHADADAGDDRGGRHSRASAILAGDVPSARA